MSERWSSDRGASIFWQESAVFFFREVKNKSVLRSSRIGDHCSLHIHWCEVKKLPGACRKVERRAFYRRMRSDGCWKRAASVILDSTRLDITNIFDGKRRDAIVRASNDDHGRRSLPDSAAIVPSHRVAKADI